MTGFLLFSILQLMKSLALQKGTPFGFALNNTRSWLPNLELLRRTDKHNIIINYERIMANYLINYSDSKLYFN